MGGGFLSPDMSFNPIAATVRWIGRRALRWCYRELRFVGRDRIPGTGATLLFGNHPNDMPDVLTGFLTTDRRLRYVATISGITVPFAALAFRALGVIPVTRVRDARKMRHKGVDVASVNRSAFDEVRAAFQAGDIVGLFPEGGVHDSSQVGWPRSGVAKMALASIDSDSKTDISMVAFGLQYEAPQTPRSDVIVTVGTPFSLRAWVASQVEPSPAALSAKLHAELLAVSRSSSTWQDAEARDLLVAAVAAVEATGGTPLLDVAARLQGRCGLLVEGKDPSQSGAEGLIVLWRTITDDLAGFVRKARGIPTSARDCARVLDAAGVPNPQAQWPSWTRIVALAIPAVVGLVLNGPLQVGVRRLALRAAMVRTDIVAWAIVPGLHLILLGYLVLGGLFALGFRAVSVPVWWAIPVVMLLPRLGDLGLAWRDDVRAMRLRARVRRFPEADRAAIRAASERVQSAWTSLPNNHSSQS